MNFQPLKDFLDGYLSMLAGVPFEIGREGDGAVQPYTMMFFVGGVDFENSDLGWGD